MAARRLILVMLALLVLSSIAAALIPVERDRVPPRESTTQPLEPTIVPGTFVHREISADADRRARIEIRVGDQLGLRVTSKKPGLVEIPAFGELENVDPAFPAHFDVLALEPGTFPVRLVDERTIARIEVAARAQSGGGSSKAAPGERTADSTPGASSAS